MSIPNRIFMNVVALCSVLLASFTMGCSTTETQQASRLEQKATSMVKPEPKTDGKQRPESYTIYFIAAAKAPNSSVICSMDRNGKNIKSLTKELGHIFVSYSWSPDGKQLAVCELLNMTISSTGMEYEYGIDLYDAEGNNLRRLTTQKHAIGYISWSPASELLAFSMTGKDNRENIYTLNVADSSIKQVTTEGGQNPSWALDGSTLVFSNPKASGKDAFGIYSIDSDGQKLVRLLETENASRDPCYSPDGRKIVFLYLDNPGQPGFSIRVFNLDDSSQVTITSKVSSKALPSWSPDGSEIIFYSDSQGISRIDTAGKNILALKIAGGSPKAR